MMTAEAGKVHDVRLGDRAPRRDQRFADAEFVECFAERMNAIRELPRSFHPLVAYRRENGRRTLERYPLHVVQHRAMAAEFVAATRPAGTAMNEVRQRRTASPGFF